MRIWGAALWDVRKALGAEVADRVIHQSFYYLKAGSPKFIDGYNAIVTADQNLNQGANKEALAKVFIDRGIAKAPTAPTLDARQIRSLINFTAAHGENAMGEALEDIRRILASREALYARADAVIDTAARTVKQSLKDLERAVPAPQATSLETR